LHIGNIYALPTSILLMGPAAPVLRVSLLARRPPGGRAAAPVLRVSLLGHGTPSRRGVTVTVFSLSAGRAAFQCLCTQ
jgi:hypothetical protein